MSTNLIQPSFASGELSPALYGRVDLAKYHVGAATMRNFFVDYKGGASTRPGTQFIGTTDTATVTRLVPFVFSATQQYILVFGDRYIEFIRNPLTAHYPNSSNAGFILSGPRYQVITPYLPADLFSLEFDQSADILQITHPSYPRMLLSRITDTNWTLTTASTGSTSVSPSSGSASISALQAGSTDPLTTTYLYTVTTVGSTGEESTPTVFIYTTGLDIAAVQGTITINWVGVNNALYYKVYKTVPAPGGKVQPYSSPFGFIGYATGPQFTDSNIVPDFTRSPPQHNDPFSPHQIVGYSITSGADNGLYPVGGTTLTVTDGTGTGAILLPILDNTTFGGTGHIVGIVILNPGDNYSTPNVTAAGGAGSGFSANLVLGPANQNPTSCAYFQQRLMLASTPNNPVTIYGSKSGYYNNFDKSNPVLDSDSISFTLAAKQVNSINHMLAMPGGLILFTDSEVLQLSGGSSSAINPLAVTPATATSVPIIPFGAQVGTRPIKVVSNILYVQSEGTIIREIIYNVFFGNLYSGNDLTVLSSHLFYPNTVVDWAYQDVPFKVVWMVRSDGQLLSMTYLKEQEVVGISRHDTNGLFESVAVIREGTTQAVYFVVNRNGTRCVERLCDRVYNQLSDIWALDCGLSYSGAPATVISGFPSFMNGTTVFALADGVSRGPFTVAGGAITLPIAASNVVAGYEYFPQLQTLYLDTNAGEGTIQGKRKKLAAMTARVKDAAGVNMGTSFQTATRFIPGISSTDPIQPTSVGGLTTGDMRMTMDSLYSVGGQMWIQIDPGLAATVTAVIPEVVLGDS